MFKKMNRSLKAFLMGYVLFKVNTKYFLLYNSAKRYKDFLSSKKCDIEFIGFNLLMGGWFGFYSLAIVVKEK